MDKTIERLRGKKRVVDQGPWWALKAHEEAISDALDKAYEGKTEAFATLASSLVEEALRDRVYRETLKKGLRAAIAASLCDQVASWVRGLGRDEIRRILDLDVLLKGKRIALRTRRRK